MPTDPPARAAFMVHGLAQAIAACTAAAATGRPIALVSAPGAAQFAGIGWFKALVDEALAAFPAVDLIAILHCGDAAGRAMQAMAHGFSYLVIEESVPALPRLRALASRYGAEIRTALPPYIDLGTVADPHATAQAALAAED